jgi:hypothetical protein
MSDVRLQGQLLGGPREMHGAPNGDHQAAARPQGVGGLVDTHELLTEHAYFPIRGGSTIEGVVLRISDARWVSIGVSTNSQNFPPGPQFDAPPLGDVSFSGSLYGATLWEDQFDGELRKIQQVDLFGSYDAAEVMVDTMDGINWFAAAMRRRGSVSPSRTPMWSARKLTVDPDTGALTMGPLIEWEYPWVSGDVPVAGDEFGIAAMTTGRAVFVSFVGLFGGAGHVYAQVLNMDAGTVGAYTKKYPADFGWTPASGFEGGTGATSAKSVSSDNALVVLVPRNIESIPSPHYQVVEAHYDADANLLSAENLIYIDYPEDGGLVGVPIRKIQLNLLNIPLVTIGNDTWTSYSWLDGARYEDDELYGTNVGGWFHGERYQYRYASWFQNDDRAGGTVAQFMNVDSDDGWADFAIHRYPGPDVLFELDRVTEYEFWFNTETEYADWDEEDEFWINNINDYVDASPGRLYLQWMWMLDTNFWCGFHRDTTGVW